MMNAQFISCSASSHGGGMGFEPNQATALSNHDVYFSDGNNLFSSHNSFYESYTTNTDEKRVCYNGKILQHTEKMWWLSISMKDRTLQDSGVCGGCKHGVAELDDHGAEWKACERRGDNQCWGKGDFCGWERESSECEWDRFSSFFDYAVQFDDWAVGVISVGGEIFKLAKITVDFRS
ncbi:uncharacterized protein MONOS_13818 [Monocercomonoides exilis]|uniref:uncharacterized protein n=1 Tax=Monocercomonoides exilis TaxID=2049356 RepID=UPI003559D041|nr:hypothetical protein MONOS_13818 [Monocercomonoides exilis]|eukprot:MONOS_13818.1-p1 / transcript=MONOS_13818.1 / gene=MONOS_13818 / organism=Monocercomonoides_exilis_PA203 / gene_product=unspecified product / transcript_product=unspecified product / location=Mono_scaffold00889:13066-13718(+) / protein_length=178 / sequence_SO=supercontig / SO=protein_coding / is_pseudo=false